MPGQYDDYRQNPQAQADPWALGSGPQQFYAPSSSLWGGVRDTVTGAATGGIAGSVIAPMTMTGPAGLALGAGIGLGVNGAKSFGGMNEIKSGELFENLGNAQNWQDFATFGRSRAKRQQGQAENDRAAAVANWRNQARNQFGGVLGQAGADVRNDLQGELDAALGVGQRGMDMNATQDAMTQFQQRYQQYMLGRQRAGQMRQVDAMFADPRREAERQQRLGAERTQGMSNIAEQYRMGQRNNSFNQARRGMMGGSTDVEQRGELARGRNQAAQGLQTGLDQKAQAYRMQDQQQRNQLMGLINSDDPNTAAAFSRTLEGINQQGALVRENDAIRQQGAALDRATSQNYSQAFGGLMSSASRPMEYYLEHQGTGA